MQRILIDPVIEKFSLENVFSRNSFSLMHAKDIRDSSISVALILVYIHPSMSKFKTIMHGPISTIKQSRGAGSSLGRREQCFRKEHIHFT